MTLFGARNTFLFFVMWLIIFFVSLQSIILRIFSPNNRTFLSYFNKSLRKVQSIHCFDDPFGPRHFFLFCCSVFDCFFLLIYIFRASFYTFLAQKTALFCLISKSHWEKYSLYTVWMTLLVLENFFCFVALFLIDFVGFTSEHYSTHF